MKVIVVHIWLLLLLLCLRNRNLAAAQCLDPPALCCPGLNNGCNRGCYCDEACMTIGDCCPDYYQTCNQSNSQPLLPSSPSPSILPSSPTSTSPDSPILEPSSSSSPSPIPPTSSSGNSPTSSSTWTTPQPPIQSSQTSAPSSSSSSQSTPSPTSSLSIASSSGQCSVPTMLCCPGHNNSCYRGCFCDEACKTIGDCCPDYYQACNQSNSQPSLPTSTTLPWTSPDSPTSSSSTSSQTSAPSSSSPSPTPPTSPPSITSLSGQCSVPTMLCCPGHNNSCYRGCFCDEACLTIGDCCPDYYQACNQSNSQPSLPTSPTLPWTSPDSPTSSSSTSSQTSAPSSSSPSPTPATPSSITSLSGQCSVPTMLCCPGHSNDCYRGCYCDEACKTIGDCCPDYYQTCNQSNSQPSLPSTPSPSTWTTPQSSTLSSSQVPDYFLPFGDGDIVNPISDDGGSEAIFLLQPFIYFGHIYHQIYVNNNGHLTFTGQLSAYVPYLNSGIDIVAPLWTDLNNEKGGTISYREDTSSAVLAQVTDAVNQYFPDVPFTASSAFVATWNRVPYFNDGGMATFQVVLVSNSDRSFILINYGDIAETGQVWLAGFDTVDSSHSFNVSLLSVSELSSNSNVNYNGRWVFHVDGVHDVCNNCTENETCLERGGVYGCGCLQGQTPENPEIFDAEESCASSTGSISLSRCQLFESGFYPETLHLNDPSCKGTLENGRLLFYFDSEGHICGTTLTSNSTHFIYQNSILSNPRNTGQSIISRDIWMNMTFSCAYPLIQTLSMPMGFRAEGGVLSKELPAGQGTYQIHMMPYHDAQFTSPYEEEQVQVNQQMYVAVEVEGVDRNQIATVLDNCWATPVNDAEYHIRWNLIIKECPNPEDTTVEVLQNGIDTTSHFSFRMFTFSGISDHVFLHCEVHLCLVQNGRCALLCNHGYRSRRHRSLDFLHSAAISMGLKAQ